MESNTAKFDLSGDRTADVHALMLVGYFISGDPTYITNYKGARGLIKRIDRDELLEVIINDYCSRL